MPILGFIDTYELACSLRTRLSADLFKGERGVRTLPLRGPPKGSTDPEDDLAYGNSRELRRWPEARAALDRIAREGQRLFGGEIEFGRVYFEMLEAGSHAGWRRETGPYSERFIRLHLAVRTNPGALLISGAEMLSPGVGAVASVNTRTWHSALNLGDYPRVHMVLDAKRKEAALFAAEPAGDLHQQSSERVNDGPE